MGGRSEDCKIVHLGGGGVSGPPKALWRFTYSKCSRVSERERTKPSDVEWLKTVASSGTLGDKIAALALQIQV